MTQNTSENLSSKHSQEEESIARDDNLFLEDFFRLFFAPGAVLHSAAYSSFRFMLHSSNMNTLNAIFVKSFVLVYANISVLC